MFGLCQSDGALHGFAVSLARAPFQNRDWGQPCGDLLEGRNVFRRTERAVEAFRLCPLFSKTSTVLPRTNCF